MSLTHKQRSLLKFICLRWERGETLPSQREICARFGYASPRAASDHIAALKQKGYLANDAESSRGYRLTEKAIGVPVLGEIPAGISVLTEELVESRLPVNPRVFGIADRDKAFLLRVRGNSMTGRRIFNGDLVLIEKADAFRNGDIVAALIDNQSTLKTFVHEKGCAFLRSENPECPDMVPALDLQIQGVARGVIRFLSQ